MFDEIILKKAAYESTLEIFRRLHSIEIKPRHHENDNTADFQTPRMESPFFHLSNKTILKMVGASEEISVEGQRRISLVFDEHCGEYAREHSHPLSNTTAVRSEVIGNKSILLIFDDQSSELDTSSDSVSTISSMLSDGTTGQQRRLSLIFDDHSSSVSSRCASVDTSMVETINEDVDVSKEDKEISTEDIALSIREGEKIKVANTVTEGIPKHYTHNDICLEGEGTSDIGVRADNTSHICVREDNNNNIGSRAGNNNAIDEGEDNNSDIDLRAIILAPSGGVELLQSEEYLKKIETPVLINILNQLASGQHDELLPLDADITVDGREVADVTVNESLDVSETEVALDNTTSITPCNTIAPADQLSVFNEANIKPESPVVETSEVTLPSDPEQCDGHIQCQLIKELRDIKQNLSTLHEAIKFSSPEQISNTENDATLTISTEALVAHTDSHGKQNLPLVGISVPDVLQSVEAKNFSGLKHNDFRVNEVDGINHNGNALDDINHNGNALDGINHNGNALDIAAVEKEVVPSHKIHGKFIPRRKSIANMNKANTANAYDTTNTFVAYSVKKGMKLGESIAESITESISKDDLNTSMYERNYIFENNKTGIRRRSTTSSSGSASPPLSSIKDKSQTLPKRSVLAHRMNISEKTNKVGVRNTGEDRGGELSPQVYDSPSGKLIRVPVLENRTKEYHTYDGEQLAVGDHRTIHLKQPIVEEIKARIIRFVELEHECKHKLETQLKIVREESEYGNDINGNSSNDINGNNDNNSNNICNNTNNKSNNNNNNNKTRSDHNNGSLSELNDYANIYLKEYIFDKDMRALEEEYLKITQVLNALQVDIETCITIPTNETILENDLVGLDKSRQDTFSDLGSVACDSITVFENDVRDINQRLRQVVVFTDPFQVVLNDITCKPLRTQCVRLRSTSFEGKIAFPGNRGNGVVKVLDNIITEADIRTVPAENKDIAQLVHEYLSRLHEYGPLNVAKVTAAEHNKHVASKDDKNDYHVENEHTITDKNEHTITDKNEHTITDKNEYVIDDDDVFWEPYNICKTSKRAKIDPPEQRLIFDNDIEEINKEMKVICLGEDVDVVTFTKEDLSILRQCIFNENINMKNTINDPYSSAEGYMGNLVNPMNVSVEQVVFNNDVQSINEEMQRLSWTPVDTVDNIDPTESNFSPLSQSSFENDCTVDTHARMCIDRDIDSSQQQNLHDDSRARVDSVKNCLEAISGSTGHEQDDEAIYNGGGNCTPIEMTKANHFHNELGSLSIESNVIYTCKDTMNTTYIISDSDKPVSDINYLHLEENGFVSNQDGDDDEEPTTPNITSEMQDFDRKFKSSAYVKETQSEEEAEPRHHTSSASVANVYGAESISRDRGSSTSSLTIVVDNERNNGVTARRSKVMENDTSQGETQEKGTSGTNAGGDDNFFNRYHSSPTDSSFDAQDVNVDSSLEDIIEQLLIIGEPVKEPFRTPVLSTLADTGTIFIELPKYVKINSKPKSCSTLKDAYLPDSNVYLPNNQNQRNPNVTLELSSSGFLPDEGDIDPYMSSIQTKGITRPRNVTSIEMSSSGSIPEGEDIDNYFSFEPFKLKSLGVT